jgi:aryl-alcohol dehydrogenase-like predicted oxidoreductase
MQTRMLGRSGIEVGAIGMGCWAIGGPWRFFDAEGNSNPAGWSEVDDEVSIDAVRTAFDTGVTLFDTAANYGAGHSEEVLGRALGSVRAEAVIATKFGYLVDPEARTVHTENSLVVENLERDCEASLRRLGTDYLDLYQLHVGSYPVEWADEVVSGLEDLVSAGKIRAYGWSTDDAERAAAFAAGKHCAVVQFAYNVLSEKYAVREVLAEADLGGLARSPLAMGILTGKMTRETTFPADDVRTELDFTEGRHAFLLDFAARLRDLMSAGGHTPAQAALAWILTGDARVVPIPGAKTAAQVRENVGALEAGPLSLDQMVRIEGLRAAALDTVRAYYDPQPEDARE